MKIKYLALYLIPISTISHPAHADHEIVSAGLNAQASLGDGYDSILQQFTGNCLVSTEENTGYVGSQKSIIKFDRSMSESQASDSLGFSVNTRAEFGLYSAKASASFARDSKSDDYSDSATYSAEVEFKNKKIIKPILTAMASSKTRNKTTFRKICGNEYIDQLKIGASLFINVKVQFARKEDKSSFDSQVKLSGPIYSISTDIKKVSSQFKKSGSISVRLLQIGGDVAKLGTVFGMNEFESKKLVGKSDNGYKSTSPIVLCSMENIDACTKVIDNAIHYASNDFVNQIDIEKNPVGSLNGPAVLQYITKNWNSAGIDLGPTLTSQAASVAKEEMSKLFNEQVSILNRIDSLGIARIRLSSSQREKISKVRTTMTKNMQHIIQSAEICYNDESKCMRELELLQGNEIKKGLVTSIDLNDLDITPETFAQFCDIAQEAKHSIRIGNTIQPLMEIARKKINDQTWENIGDKCAFAENILNEEHSISLPFMNVYDVIPISTLGNIEELYINGNDIRDISALSKLKKLKILSISSTKVDNLDPLMESPQLTTIFAQNTLTLNRFEEIRKKLNRVQISFNSNESCELERNRLYQNRNVTENEYIEYKESNSTPIYSKMGDRFSGINYWSKCDLETAHGL